MKDRFLFRDYYIVEARLNNIISDNDNNYENSTTKGWIRVQGTSLDMPVIVTSDKLYPLDRENYAWFKDNNGNFQKKINIMGHNIYNLAKKPLMTSPYFKRFEELMSFVYFDFAKNNKYIQLTIDNEEYLYKIFSVSFLSNAYVDLFSTHKSIDELEKEINIIKKYSFYDYDLDVNMDDNFISLITCTRMMDGKELVVTGRMIRKGEKIDDYKIKKANKYTEIEDILKGDGSNEDFA